MVLNFRIEKKNKKRKGDKLYVKRKGNNNQFNSWISKKNIVLINEYFPKPKSVEVNVTVESDWSNYATKADFKNATDVDTSVFDKKTDLANLKSDVDKLDIDKLKIVPSGWRSLKSKIDKWVIGKLETAPFDLSKELI